MSVAIYFWGKNGYANPVLFIELHELLGEASEVSHSENFSLGMKSALEVLASAVSCMLYLLVIIAAEI